MPTSARLGKFRAPYARENTPAIRRDGWRVLFRFLFRAVQRVQAQFPRQLEQGVRHDLLRRQVCLPPYLFIKSYRKSSIRIVTIFTASPPYFQYIRFFL